MNPELWTTNYDWSPELYELKERLKSHLAALAQAKRISFDPFADLTIIRCTIKSCHVRDSLPSAAFREAVNEAILDSIVYLSSAAHSHFVEEIGLRLDFLRGGNLLRFRAKTGKILVICPGCKGRNPFPISETLSWNHDALHNWSIHLGKPNTLSWKNPTWVLQINFVQSLWQKLYLDFSRSKVIYDEKAVCWLVADSVVDEVANSCKIHLPTFTHTPKPKLSSKTPHALTISKKSIAAGEILSLLPPEALKKLYRFMCLELHPDKVGPEGTEIFQRFQQSWGKWEKS